MAQLATGDGAEGVEELMRRAKVDGQWIDLPDGVVATCSLGDKTPIYDTCGCLGLCKDCLELAQDPHTVAIEGCGKHYVAMWFMAQGDDDRWLVTMPDGTEFYADEIKQIDIVFGEGLTG